MVRLSLSLSLSLYVIHSLAYTHLSLTLSLSLPFILTYIMWNSRLDTTPRRFAIFSSYLQHANISLFDTTHSQEDPRNIWSASMRQSIWCWTRWAEHGWAVLALVRTNWESVFRSFSCWETDSNSLSIDERSKWSAWRDSFRSTDPSDRILAFPPDSWMSYLLETRRNASILKPRSIDTDYSTTSKEDSNSSPSSPRRRTRNFSRLRRNSSPPRRFLASSVMMDVPSGMFYYFSLSRLRWGFKHLIYIIWFFLITRFNFLRRHLTLTKTNTHKYTPSQIPGSLDQTVWYARVQSRDQEDRELRESGRWMCCDDH